MKKPEHPVPEEPVKLASSNLPVLPAVPGQPDYARLYQLLLAEERRLRLWLSHMAQDYPDNPLATAARQALAGVEAPLHVVKLEK